MSECDFNVGQKLTYWERGGGPTGIVSVVRITKSPKCIHMSDGTKWEWSGFKPWSSDRSYSWYNGPTLRPMQPEDEAAIRRAIVIRRLCRVGQPGWEKLTPSALDQVVAILKSAGAWETSK